MEKALDQQAALRRRSQEISERDAERSLFEDTERVTVPQRALPKHCPNWRGFRKFDPQACKRILGAQKNLGRGLPDGARLEIGKGLTRPTRPLLVRITLWALATSTGAVPPATGFSWESR